MAAIIEWDSNNRRRAENMVYDEVLLKHAGKITEWHLAGWTHVEIRDGLRGEGEQVSPSQVQVILRRLSLTRANKGRRARSNPAFENISRGAPGHTTTYSVAHTYQDLTPTRSQPDQDVTMIENDNTTAGDDAETGASSLQLYQESRETPVSSNTDRGNDSPPGLTSVSSSPAASNTTSLETLGDEPSGFRPEKPRLHSLDEDDEEFYRITGFPPPQPSTESTLRAAELLLACEPLDGTREFIKLGQVFAMVVEESVLAGYDSNGLTPMSAPDRIRLWLVVKKYNDCCFCIRIRTYQGNGIRRLKVEYEQQSRIEDQLAVQKEIDAHTIIYPAGLRRPFSDLNEEPFMKKESLGVRLDAGLEHGVIDRMSRASFRRLYAYQYDKQVRSVGRLTWKSRECLKSYASELVGDTLATALRR